MVNEYFLHFIWQNELFNTNDVVVSTGESLQVIDVGEPNPNAGPDFFNVKIKIGETIWIGCAEVHIRSSDWIKHNHHSDKAYNNVVLHIVAEDDKVINRANGEVIPAFILRYNNNYLKSYQLLYANNQWIACQDKIPLMNSFIIRQWLSRLTIERLERKSNTIMTLLEKSMNSWEDVLYKSLARSFGFKVNTLPFEMLASHLPLKYIEKQRDNLLQVEAMLFGVAGFLDGESTEDYCVKLKEEYDFLSKKYKLRSLDKYIWKFSKLRPVNFPTIRIAQFAALFSKSSFRLSRILFCKDVNELKEYLQIRTSEYWNTHYNFGKISKYKKKVLGEAALDSIIINTVVPVLFTYGKVKNDPQYIDLSIQILEEIKPENNSIIRRWEEIGIPSNSAFFTQALLQLKNDYCKFKRCLNCQFGNTIILSNK